MSKNKINHHLNDTIIQENNSSFLDITSVRSLKSNSCESSIATFVTVGSEPPESISAYSESRHEIKKEVQIGEFCSQCMQKGREQVAATHFCKQCKPFGKYLCYKCLKEHNAWSGHKRIYSLTQWKCKKTEKTETSSTVQKENVSDKNDFLNNWLREQPASVTNSARSATSATTYQESECLYYSLPSSDVYDHIGTQTESTLQTPAEDYSSIGSSYIQTSTSTPTHDVRHIDIGDSRYDQVRTQTESALPTPAEDYSSIGSFYIQTSASTPTHDVRHIDIGDSSAQKSTSPWTLLPAKETNEQRRELPNIMSNDRYNKLMTNNAKQDQRYDALYRPEHVYTSSNEGYNSPYDTNEIDEELYEDLPEVSRLRYPTPRNSRYDEVPKLRSSQYQSTRNFSIGEFPNKTLVKETNVSTSGYKADKKEDKKCSIM